ncbi:hypothetical protein PRIPAC_71103 [Pristionchus pacificus]|uniref:Uncharacterized protein n=1 Tax=Pristionchus pacificus TaxID=54126 RepID=A0A2A6CR37_PRIPA|nr:hypothetical protein PRIPAC_71103 [Pristionchus pacificus]|eukprot:PDM80599.1 hypothetical protein PRIPAC_35602 [Pristionchus pacificus]
MGYQPVPQGYPPQQGGYPPPQQGYPPPQQGYPLQQGGYPPPQGVYPPPQQGYPPPQGGGGGGPNKCVMIFLICIFMGMSWSCWVTVLMKEGKCSGPVWINLLLEFTLIGGIIHAAWFCFCKN